MSSAQPSVAEERWIAVAARHLVGDLPDRERRCGDWKTVSTLSRCLFFVLGLIAAGMSMTIVRLLLSSGSGLFIGALLIGVAEWLIRRKRLFAAGIEEALWAAGAVGIAVEVIDTGTRWRDIGIAAALITAAFGLAGWRLRNPLLTTLGALAASVTVAALASDQMNSTSTLAGTVFCFASGTAALLAGSLQFKRPSNDRMLDWLVVSLPLAGFAWTLLYRHGPLLPVSLLLGFAAAATVTGLRRRTHAPLLSTLGCLACVAYELRGRFGNPLEVDLLLWGTVGLALAIAVERWLRRPRRGITSQDIDGASIAQDLVQSVGASTLTPHGAAGHPEYRGEGGGFGGGGASGRYK
jgi:hypothetical protein